MGAAAPPAVTTAAAIAATSETNQGRGPRSHPSIDAPVGRVTRTVVEMPAEQHRRVRQPLPSEAPMGGAERPEGSRTPKAVGEKDRRRGDQLTRDAERDRRRAERQQGPHER